jgi:hypothetical protein
MYEEDIENFHSKIEAFSDNFSGYVEFLDYFEKQWCTEPKFNIWSRAYHPLEFSHMLTNNYIESWYNQSKSTYLLRARNKRIDRLLYILVVEIEQDLKQESEWISENAGAMTRSEKRRVEISAEIVSPERRAEMTCDPVGNKGNSSEVNKTMSGNWIMESFTEEGLSYVLPVQDAEIQKCSYYAYNKYRRTCKHMYLLHLFTNFSIFDQLLLMLL